MHSLMAADQVIRFDGPSCQSTAMPALQSDDDVCAGGGAGRVASRAVLLPVPTMRPRRDPRAGKPARKQTRIISALWPLRSPVRFDSRGLARPTRHHSPGGYSGSGSARLGLVISKGLFKAPQLTGEKKPALGSGDEAPVVPLVPAGFCQLLFGNRAALGRRIKHTPLQITR